MCSLGFLFLPLTGSTFTVPQRGAEGEVMCGGLGGTVGRSGPGSAPAPLSGLEISLVRDLQEQRYSGLVGARPGPKASILTRCLWNGIFPSAKRCHRPGPNPAESRGKAAPRLQHHARPSGTTDLLGLRSSTKRRQSPSGQQGRSGQVSSRRFLLLPAAPKNRRTALAEPLSEPASAFPDSVLISQIKAG